MTENAPLDAVEDTALLQACWRAAEARRPTPRLLDPVAEAVVAALVPPARRIRYTASLPAYADIHLATVLACDRRLAQWASTPPPRQLVVLGCGFDGRAVRIPALSDAAMFLVDRGRVLARLAPFLASRTPVHLVEANLARPDLLLASLDAAGWRPEVPTAFVAEGVAEFLGEAGTRGLLAAVLARSAPGSLVLVQILSPRLVRYAVEQGDVDFPWRKLPDPAAALGMPAAERLPYDGPCLGDDPALPLSHVFAIAKEGAAPAPRSTRETDRGRRPGTVESSSSDGG